MMLVLLLLPMNTVQAYTFEDYEDVNENGIFVDRHVDSDTLTSTITVLLYTQSSGRNLMNFENSICFWYKGPTEELGEDLGIQLRLRPWNFKTNDPFLDGSLWTVSGRIENGYYNFHIRDTICAKAQLGLVGILTENFEEPFTHQVDTPVLTKVEDEDVVLYGIYAQDYEWYTEHVDEFIAWAKEHEKERLEKQLMMENEYARINGEDNGNIQDNVKTMDDEAVEKQIVTEEVIEKVGRNTEATSTNKKIIPANSEEDTFNRNKFEMSFFKLALLGVGVCIVTFIIVFGIILFISRINRK